MRAKLGKKPYRKMEGAEYFKLTLGPVPKGFDKYNPIKWIKKGDEYFIELGMRKVLPKKKRG